MSGAGHRGHRATDAVGGQRLILDDPERARLDEAVPAAASFRRGPTKVAAAAAEGEVVLVVLDNTYATRASRFAVVEAASRHGVPVRCVHLDTSIEEAQINAVHRMVEHLGELPSPLNLRGRDHASCLRGPSSTTAAPSRPRPRTKASPPWRSSPSSGPRRRRAPLALSSSRSTASCAGAARAIGRLEAPTTSTSSPVARRSSLATATKAGCSWGPRGNRASKRARTPKRRSAPPSTGVLHVRRHRLDPNASIFVGRNSTDRTFARRLGFTYREPADLFGDDAGQR